MQCIYNLEKRKVEKRNLRETLKFFCIQYLSNQIEYDLRF